MSALLVFFSVPLKSKHILQNTDRVDGIHFVYTSKGTSNNYSLSKDQGVDFRFLFKMLNDVTYKRKLNTFRGGTGDALLITVVYSERDGTISNYLVDIREKGVLITNNKEYRINGDSKKLIDKLVKWIKISESEFK